MGIVDGVDLDLGVGMAKTKFLQDFVVLVNVTLLIKMSVLIPSILLPMVMPNSLAEDTHGHGSPKRIIEGSGRVVWRKARHFVLHFLGFLSVLKRGCVIKHMFHKSVSSPVVSPMMLPILSQ